MFRRSDFIEARYAFSFVFANFGIAIAARIPMITTTIRSSISVKPFRLFLMAVSFGQGSYVPRLAAGVKTGGCLTAPPGLHVPLVTLRFGFDGGRRNRRNT